MGKGPNIPQGFDLPASETVDLAPTILNLMNAKIPEYLDGKNLLQNTPSSTYSA